MAPRHVHKKNQRAQSRKRQPEVQRTESQAKLTCELNRQYPLRYHVGLRLSAVPRCRPDVDAGCEAWQWKDRRPGMRIDHTRSLNSLGTSLTRRRRYQIYDSAQPNRLLTSLDTPWRIHSPMERHRFTSELCESPAGCAPASRTARNRCCVYHKRCAPSSRSTRSLKAIRTRGSIRCASELRLIAIAGERRFSRYFAVRASQTPTAPHRVRPRFLHHAQKNQ